MKNVKRLLLEIGGIVEMTKDETNSAIRFNRLILKTIVLDSLKSNKLRTDQDHPADITKTFMFLDSLLQSLYDITVDDIESLQELISTNLKQQNND